MPEGDDDLEQQTIFSPPQQQDTLETAEMLTSAMIGMVSLGQFIREEIFNRVMNLTRYVSIPVRSSAIASLSYAAGSGEMTVRFNDGSEYIIDAVPVSSFLAFLNAPSKGTHWNRYFRSQSASQFQGSKKQRIRVGRSR